MNAPTPAQPIRVLHLFWSLTFGGIETMLVNIANAQAAAGARVSVLLINDLYEPTLIEGFHKEVRLLRAGRKRHSRSPLFLLRLWALMLGERPQVIHLHGSGLLCVVPWWLRKRCCCTLHDVPQGTLLPPRGLKRLLPLLDIGARGNVRFIHRVPRVAAISGAVHDALLADYGVESTVVCNGILTSAFRRRGDRPAGEPLRIVMVSRLVHDKKGQDLLIEAVASLRGRAVVDFVGIGESLPYLQELTARLGAEPWVRFLGSRTQAEVRDLLADYDLFAQPSRFEGFGLTVAEAMAAGVPVVVSRGQGSEEVTQGDRYGWTFTNGSVAELADLIAHVIAHYPAALEKAERAAQHVRHTYDVGVTAGNYLDLYRSLIDKPKNIGIMTGQKLNGGGKYLVVALVVERGTSERRCA